MNKDLYIKNKKGEESVYVSYQSGTGIILKIEVYAELTEDWIEIACADPMPASNKWLITKCQQYVDDAEYSEMNSPEAFWFGKTASAKAGGDL